MEHQRQGQVSEMIRRELRDIIYYHLVYNVENSPVNPVDQNHYGLYPGLKGCGRVIGAGRTCDRSQVRKGWGPAFAVNKATVSNPMSHRGRDSVFPPGEPVLVDPLSSGENFDFFHHTTVQLDPQTQRDLFWLGMVILRELDWFLWRIWICRTSVVQFLI